ERTIRGSASGTGWSWRGKRNDWTGSRTGGARVNVRKNHISKARFSDRPANVVLPAVSVLFKGHQRDSRPVRITRARKFGCARERGPEQRLLSLCRHHRGREHRQHCSQGHSNTEYAAHTNPSFKT